MAFPALEDMVSAFGWTLVHATWQGVVAAFALRLGRRITTNADVRGSLANYTLSLFLLSQVITFAAVLWLSRSHPRAIYVDDAQLHAAFNRVSKAGIVRHVPVPAAVTGSSWIDRLGQALPIAITVWAGVALLLASRVIVATTLFSRLARNASDVTAAYRAEVQTLLGMSRAARVRILESAQFAEPAMGGWWYPTVLLTPPNAPPLTPLQRKAIVLHELAHARRDDFAAHAVRELVRSLYRFHPAISWVCSLADADAEEAADELASGVLGDPIVYSQALLAIGRSRHQRALQVRAAGGSLSQRVKRILSGTGARQRPRRSLALAGAIGAALAASMAVGAVTLAKAQDRREGEWLRTHDVGQVAIATIARDQANPAAEAEFAHAVREVRDEGQVSDDTLSRLVEAVSAGGMQSDLLASIFVEHGSARDTKELTPYGRAADRKQIATALGLAASDPSRSPHDRQRYARAAVLIAALELPIDNGVMLKQQLQRPENLNMLGLATSDAFRIQIAWALHDQRWIDAAPACLPLLQRDAAPTAAELERALRKADLVPFLRVRLLVVAGRHC